MLNSIRHKIPSMVFQTRKKLWKKLSQPQKIVPRDGIGARAVKKIALQIVEAIGSSPMAMSR